eukprot:gb/GECG01016632.1/.p1 GENE.gb/GECG01016632.1/~~gb/GECG01016632.1/.p1  ORF type:complete len:494 (+),score=36.14 gb/GECG01016632.1/:1-1482(+)
MRPWNATAATTPWILLLLLLVHVVHADNQPSCPKQGCDVFNTHHFREPLWSHDASLELSLVWRNPAQNTFSSSPESNVCIDCGTQVTCRWSGGFTAFNSSGTVVGNFSLASLEGSKSVPVVDDKCQLITWSSRDVFSLAPNLASNWVRNIDPPIKDTSAMISPTVTNSSIVMFAVQHIPHYQGTSDLIFGYDGDGRPLAKIYLTGSVEGQSGTFHPITSPAIIGSRLFYLTQFGSSKPSRLRPTQMQSTYCAVVAVDQMNQIDGRLLQRWNLPFSCSTTEILVGPVVAGKSVTDRNKLLIYGLHDASSGLLRLYALKDLMGSTPGQIAWQQGVAIQGSNVSMALSNIYTSVGNQTLWLSATEFEELLKINPATGHRVGSIQLTNQGQTFSFTAPISTAGSVGNSSIEYIIGAGVSRSSHATTAQAGIILVRTSLNSQGSSIGFSAFPADGLGDAAFRQVGYIQHKGTPLIVVPLQESGLAAYAPKDLAIHVDQ